MNYAGNISITQAFWGNKTLTPYNAFVGEYPLLDIQDDRLRFEAIEYSTFVLSSLASVSTVEYSIDGGTTWHNVGTTLPVALLTGDIAYIRGKISGDLSSYDYTQFEMTGKIAVEGNIMYLRNYENPSSLVIPYERCFYRLFFNCTSLVQAHRLRLPATTLATSCYDEMFAACYNLVYAPSLLPATSLVRNCYVEMFRGCTSLTTAPLLPATSLAFGCYLWMFRGCTSLTTAPSLPATILADYCYTEMFRDCNNLTSIECLATDISAESCTSYWVYNVASSGTFVKASAAMTAWSTDESGIPEGWTVIDKLP